MSLKKTCPTTCPTSAISSSFPPLVVSPSVYYGSGCSFTDTKGVTHPTDTFADAVTVLFVMYTDLFKSYGFTVEDEAVLSSIKSSPTGNYAYLSLKLR